MQIGQIRLANRLILAPMAGVTDRPFRQLCRRLGAALAVSEMVAADPALWGSRKSRQRLDHSGEIGPIAVQIVGADPQTLAEAARVNGALGAEIVDINMGCPAKKVCKVAAGSALMRDEAQVGRILDAVVAAAGVPVTLKIRTGWSPGERNALRIAHIAREAGIAALTVHGRTRACGFAGAAEYDTIRAIKAEVAIPLIANGDIDSPEKASAVLDYTGADAIMLGRAAQGRPWIFQEVTHYLATGNRLPAPPAAWIRDTLLAHLDGLYGLYGVVAGVRIARKHIGWYCGGDPQGTRLRASINRAESAERQRALIEAHFDGLGEGETSVLSGEQQRAPI
jgi:tRNA-dihydrouridine synthase B